MGRHSHSQQRAETIEEFERQGGDLVVEKDPEKRNGYWEGGK